MRATRPPQVIFPHEANLKQLASSLGVSGDLHDLCQNEQIQEAVLKALNAVGKKSHLKPLETLQTIVLTDTEWTPQNEMLTAAQKLNRKVILKKHKKEIDVRPSFHLGNLTDSLTWLPYPLVGGLPVIRLSRQASMFISFPSIPPIVLSPSLRPLMTSHLAAHLSACLRRHLYSLASLFLPLS